MYSTHFVYSPPDEKLRFSVDFVNTTTIITITSEIMSTTIYLGKKENLIDLKTRIDNWLLDH
jgi:hypothetical protein